MENETFTNIQLNDAGQAYVVARLEGFGLAWDHDATFAIIEERAEIDGADHVAKHGFVYQTNTRCPIGYTQTIDLDPEHFIFTEQEG